MLKEDKFKNRDGLELHYMEQASYDNDTKPVLIIPALPESDMDYKDIIYILKNHTICVTPRGRELSDAPETGYSLQDHANDIIDTIKHFELKDIIIIAYSRGVAYFLKALPELKNKIIGVLLIDYPAEYEAHPDEWSKKFLNQSWRAMPIKERFPKPWVLERIEEESKEEKLWGNLKYIECPVTLFSGSATYTDPILISSKIKEEHIRKYQMYLPQLKVEVFENSGHDLRLWQYEEFIAKIQSFIDEVTPKSKINQILELKNREKTNKTYFGLDKDKAIKLN